MHYEMCSAEYVLVHFSELPGSQVSRVMLEWAPPFPPGVDPDLLVFGKYFSSNVRVFPHHYSRVNASEPLPPDKRQFIHPPPPAPLPPTPPTVTPHPDSSTPTLHTTTTQRPTDVETLTSSSEDGATPTAAPAFSSTAPPSSGTGTTTDPPYPTTFSPTAARHSASSSHHHHHHTPTSQLPTTLERSEHPPSDTEGGVGENQTAGGEGGQAEEEPAGGFGPGWHVAAHTLMVAVAVCITVLLCCCSSFLSLVSWRGQRKRAGRYRTPQADRRGSMRLIKYVLVRENAEI